MPDVLDEKFARRIDEALNGKRTDPLAEGFYLGGYYVPGVHDEVEEHPTIIERIMTRMVDTPLYAAERQDLLQEARRKKLATDLQAMRIQKRLDRAEAREKARKAFRPVATWTMNDFYQGEKKPENELTATMSLQENAAGDRKVKLVSVRIGTFSRVVEPSNQVFEFMTSCRAYNNLISPWYTHTWSLKRLEKEFKKANYSNSTLRVF